MSKKSKDSLSGFKATCYSIAKTIFGGSGAVGALKETLGSGITADFGFGLLVAFAATLFFLLLGLLAED